MDEGSVIQEIEETHLHGCIRTLMDGGSIILVIWVKYDIGVAQIWVGRMFAHSSSLKERFTCGGFATWSINVHIIIGKLHYKSNWCG